MFHMSRMTNMKLDIGVEDRPMTAKQAADYLQVNWQKLRDWEVRLGLPVHRLGVGPKAQRRFYRAELDQWVKSRCINTDPGNGE